MKLHIYACICNIVTVENSLLVADNLLRKYTFCWRRRLLLAASALPPVIAFLPYSQNINATAVLPVVQTEYGVSTENSIYPCSANNSTKGCGAVALDNSGNDISDRIVAVDVSPCPVNQTCPGCDIGFANAGLCAPGNYLFMFRYS